MTTAARPWSQRLPFYYGWVIVAVAFVCVLFVPQITLRGRGPGQNLEKATEAASPEGPVTPDEPSRAVRAD